MTYQNFEQVFIGNIGKLRAVELWNDQLEDVLVVTELGCTTERGSPRARGSMAGCRGTQKLFRSRRA